MNKKNMDENRKENDPENKMVENRARRCPMLGGEVPFSYCIQCGDGSFPCFKVFDCWWEIFDVVSHLKEHLPEDMFEKISRWKPEPKTARLVDLAHRVRKGESQN